MVLEWLAKAVELLIVASAVGGLAWGGRALWNHARQLDGRMLTARREELARSAPAFGFEAHETRIRGRLQGHLVTVGVEEQHTVVRVAIPLPELRVWPGTGTDTGDKDFDASFRVELRGRGRGWLSIEVRRELLALGKAVQLDADGISVAEDGAWVRPPDLDRLLRRVGRLITALERADHDLSARVMEDPNPRVRMNNLRDLGQLDAERAIAVARARLLQEPEPALRVELAGVGGVDDVLVDVVADAHAPVPLRTRAAAWTRDRRDDALAALVASSRGPLWRAALDLTAERPLGEVTAVYQRMTADPAWAKADPTLKADLLDRLDDAPWCRAVLRDALGDARVVVQLAAARRLKAVGTVEEVGVLRDAQAKTSVLAGALPGALGQAIEAIRARADGDRGALSLAELGPSEGELALARPERSAEGG